MNQQLIREDAQKQSQPRPLTPEERDQISAIYEKYRVDVERIASRFTKNKEEQAELASEYWTRFCEKRLFMDHDAARGSFKQFLNATCRNLFIDIIRKWEKFRKNYRPVPIDDRPKSEGFDVISSDFLVDDRDPLMELIKTEAETTIAAAVHRLPRRQQQVFKLRYLRGLSIKETALKLGIGKASVKTHLSKARKTVRASLAVLYSLYKTLK